MKDNDQHAPDCYGGPGMRGICTCKIKPGVIKFPETAKYNTIAVGEEETFETVITPKPTPSPLAVVREALEVFALSGTHFGAVVRGPAREALAALDELEADMGVIGKYRDKAREAAEERAGAQTERARAQKAADDWKERFKVALESLLTLTKERDEALSAIERIRFELNSKRDMGRCEGMAALTIADAERVNGGLICAEVERDEARATVANLQQMLAAVRATGAFSPGDDWVTAIPEALAELAERREQVDQLQQSVDERNVEISGLRSTQNDLCLQVSALEVEDARNGWTRTRTARIKHLESLAEKFAGVEKERNKFRTAASVICGAHVGQSQPACPVCMVERYRDEVEEWEKAVFLACAGNIATPDKPSTDAVRPSILRELGEHIDTLEGQRDSARTDLASMQREKVNALITLNRMKAASGAAPEDLEGVAREICRAIQDSQGAHPEPSVVVATGYAMAWARDIRAHRCPPLPTEEEDYTSEELKTCPPEYWVCKIGPTTRDHLLDGADSPMRQAISAAFLSVAGHEPGVCFSGWGNKLLMSEREALGPDDPVVPRLAAPLGEWQLEAMERALECVEAAGKESLASALSRVIAGQRRRAR